MWSRAVEKERNERKVKKERKVNKLIHRSKIRSAHVLHQMDVLPPPSVRARIVHRRE